MVVRSRPRCWISTASHPRSRKCCVWLSLQPVRADDVPLKPGLCHALARRATRDERRSSCARQPPSPSRTLAWNSLGTSIRDAKRTARGPNRSPIPAVPTAVSRCTKPAGGSPEACPECSVPLHPKHGPGRDASPPSPSLLLSPALRSLRNPGPRCCEAQRGCVVLPGRIEGRWRQLMTASPRTRPARHQAARLARWTSSSSVAASKSQSIRSLLMKNVGVPLTPLSTPLWKSSMT
jgi:hypothetical protein